MTIEAGETSLSTRKLLIESAGYNCLSAISAEQALRLAEAHPIHGVVLDSDVDDIPHAEFIDSFRKLRPNVPFYLLSHDRWTPAGLDNRINKTFAKMGDPQEIVQELSAAFPARPDHGS